MSDHETRERVAGLINKAEQMPQEPYNQGCALIAIALCLSRIADRLDDQLNVNTKSEE